MIRPSPSKTGGASEQERGYYQAKAAFVKAFSSAALRPPSAAPSHQPSGPPASSSSSSNDPLEASCIAPRLLLGSCEVERSADLLTRHSVTHILQVGTELQPSHAAAGITYLSLPIFDVEEEDLVALLPACLSFLEQALNDGGVVLVHCVAGVSRSAAIVVAHIMWSQGVAFAEARAIVKAARPRVNLNLGFTLQLQLFEKLGLAGLVRWGHTPSLHESLACCWQPWSLDRFLEVKSQHVDDRTVQGGGGGSGTAAAALEVEEEEVEATLQGEAGPLPGHRPEGETEAPSTAHQGQSAAAAAAGGPVVGCTAAGGVPRYCGVLEVPGEASCLAADDGEQREPGLELTGAQAARPSAAGPGPQGRVLGPSRSLGPDRRTVTAGPAWFRRQQQQPSQLDLDLCFTDGRGVLVPEPCASPDLRCWPSLSAPAPAPAPEPASAHSPLYSSCPDGQAEGGTSSSTAGTCRSQAGEGSSTGRRTAVAELPGPRAACVAPPDPRRQHPQAAAAAAGGSQRHGHGRGGSNEEEERRLHSRAPACLPRSPPPTPPLLHATSYLQPAGAEESGRRSPWAPGEAGPAPSPAPAPALPLASPVGGSLYEYALALRHAASGEGLRPRSPRDAARCGRPGGSADACLRALPPLQLPDGCGSRPSSAQDGSSGSPCSEGCEAVRPLRPGTAQSVLSSFSFGSARSSLSSQTPGLGLGLVRSDSNASSASSCATLPSLRGSFGGGPWGQQAAEAGGAMAPPQPLPLPQPLQQPVRKGTVPVIPLLLPRIVSGAAAGAGVAKAGAVAALSSGGCTVSVRAYNSCSRLNSPSPGTGPGSRQLQL